MPTTIQYLSSRNNITQERRQRALENKERIREYVNSRGERVKRDLDDSEFLENSVWLLFDKFIGSDIENPIIKYLSSDRSGTKIKWVAVLVRANKLMVFL